MIDMRKLALFVALTSALCAADRSKSVAWDDSYTIVPHIACGGGWTTTMNVVSTATYATQDFQLQFYDDNGAPVNVQVTGTGNVSSVNGSVPPRAEVTYELANCTPASASPITGWAELSIPNPNVGWLPYVLTDFRQTIPDRPDFEAVVPISSRDDDRLSIAFDNTGAHTAAMAIVNPDVSPVAYQVELYDPSGNLLTTGLTLTLGARAHQAFVFKTQWPVTANKSGVLRLYSNTNHVAAFGLIFNDSGAFTSAPSMPGTEPNPAAQ